MKIAGVELTEELRELNEDVLVLPRGKRQIVFTARALPDLDELDNLVPQPKPRKVFIKGKGWVLDEDNDDYKTSMSNYGKLRVAYFVIASLRPSEIEWDTVDESKPSTWVNWENDLKSNGFTQQECNLILQFCFEVNQLDEKKLEAARRNFLAGQALLADESLFPSTEQDSSQSGTPVNDGE